MLDYKKAFSYIKQPVNIIYIILVGVALLLGGEKYGFEPIMLFVLMLLSVGVISNGLIEIFFTIKDFLNSKDLSFGKKKVFSVISLVIILSLDFFLFTKEFHVYTWVLVFVAFLWSAIPHKWFGK